MHQVKLKNNAGRCFSVFLKKQAGCITGECPLKWKPRKDYGYENIECNLSESSLHRPATGVSLGISIGDLLLYYGDHAGKPELRELIASENKVDADDILITPGAAPALFIAATALLEKDDHIVVAKSNYATNIETPRAIGARVSFLPMRFENGYALDPDELDSFDYKRHETGEPDLSAQSNWRYD